MRRWEKKLSKAIRMPLEKEQALKSELEEYEKTLSEEYWSNWVKNPYKKEMGSFISH